MSLNIHSFIHSLLCFLFVYFWGLLVLVFVCLGFIFLFFFITGNTDINILLLSIRNSNAFGRVYF